MEGIFPASWISANFDVWIGHAEDVRAWDLLRAMLEGYSNAPRSAGVHQESDDAWGKWTPEGERAYEAVLAAEGERLTGVWWYGSGTRLVQRCGLRQAVPQAI